MLAGIKWRLICGIYVVTVITVANSLESAVQGSKCPFQLTDIESSLANSEAHKPGIWENVQTFLQNMWETVFGSEDSSVDKLKLIDVPLVHLKDDCKDPSSTQCDPSAPYRTHDGTCNNLQNPTWGVAEECQLRLLPAVYEGVKGFRKSVTGDPLPEPRDLSNNVLPIADRPAESLSQMFAIFGQFVAHDLVQTPTPTRNTDPCCPYDERNKARPECAPIFMRPDDPFYKRFNKTCMTFERTNTCARCSSQGEEEKTNKATPALDLNHVYGTSQNWSNLLRTNDGTGKMRYGPKSEDRIPPTNIGDFSNFCDPDNPTSCFLAGDDRVDMHASLTSMHALALREHNRLASRLKELNPKWNGETLYHQARKIFGGLWQNIIYDEFLPLLLGPRHMTHFGLWVGTKKGAVYKSRARMGMWLEVSTAGFRLHTMVNSRTGVDKLRFYKTIMHPDLITSGCAETLIEGACKVPSQLYDRYFVVDMDGYFMRIPVLPSGLDSASIDIHRGRDNGLPTYVQMIHFLTGGEIKITSFDDLEPLMTRKHIELLKKNYKSVLDVDLWLGLQLEKHPRQSSVGFGSATLSALQFHNLKYGDRFYFENTDDPAASFTKAQLKSLRRSSLARLICDNTKVKSIQKHALKLISPGNPVVDCSTLAKVDLTPWRTNS